MKIAVVTDFASMMDFYSLTSVVRTQLNMIRTAGHHPVLITQEEFRWDDAPDWLEVRHVIKSHNRIDYVDSKLMTDEHKAVVPVIAKDIQAATLDLDACLAHDLIFTGWNLIIGAALRSYKSQVPWLHWIHSVASGRRDYWELPENSVLVYPNGTDRVQCAENFNTWPERVITIPHCVDIRDIFMRTNLGDYLATKYNLLQPDLVQVYPLPSDRAESKGILEVIKLFGCFKRLGLTVKLLVPNAWCNVDQWRVKVVDFMQFAKREGLNNDEVIFISQVEPEHEIGLSRPVISDLEHCSNIFICPTKSETFGLSLAEAALVGNLLILNADLPMMKEIVGGPGNAVWAKFGSVFYNTLHEDYNKYMMDIAKIAIHVFRQSPAIRAKTYYRQKYRREVVWQQIEGAILKMQSKSANA